MHIDISALRLIEAEKGVSIETVLDAIETALLTAYRHTDGFAPHARIDIDRKSGQVRVMAQELDEDRNVVHEWDDTPEGFGRIAATTARQVILQRLRDAENEKSYGELVAHEGEVVAAVGARTAEGLMLAWRLREAGARVVLATDDGSAGVPGTVVGAVAPFLAEKWPDAVYGCGPEPMLAALAERTAALGLPWGKREFRETREKAEEVLKTVGLYNLRNSLAKNLPYGRQRILEIARILMAEGSILLLDEPAAGLNHSETEELSVFLRQLVREGLTILLVEHDMQMVMSLCDRITVINYGVKIADVVCMAGKTRVIVNPSSSS